jgi:hypothetical protein
MSDKEVDCNALPRFTAQRSTYIKKSTDTDMKEFTAIA